MKVGVFSAILSDLPLEKALDYIAGLRCETVEIGTGAYPGDAHCKPAELLKSAAKLKEFTSAVKERGLHISSLSCHGNPLHPRPEIARRDDAAVHVWPPSRLITRPVSAVAATTIFGSF